VSTPTPIAARPAGPLHGTLAVPGDKSISHRALIRGALAVGETEIRGLLEGDDVMRTAAALRLLRQMLRQESGAPYILTMIQRQLRHLAMAREMMDAGESSGRIGEALRLPGFALDRLLEQATRYPEARLQGAFQRLLEADLHIKRGIYQDELALELLVQDLAEPPRPVGVA
jgi:hypothetical protein